jgi:hypothetical protein
MLSDQLGLNAVSIPEFAAGLVFGLTGNNDLPELQTCIFMGDEILE